MMINPKSQTSPFAKASGDSPSKLEERRRTNPIPLRQGFGGLSFEARRAKEDKSQNFKQTSFGHWLLDYWLLFGIWCLVIGFFSGCASMKEVVKSVAGVSTKALEDSRKDAIRKTFNYDINSCYNKVKEILKKMDSYIYAEDLKKHMIAVYVSREDTTPVGIFFKEIDANNIQIEVSSPSTYAKEFIAKNLFSVLDKLLTIEELEAQIHAKK